MLTMLVVSALIGTVTLAIVLLISARSSERRLVEIEHRIEESIKTKGKILTENHALALRSMVLDNAFIDMQSLLDRAVNEDTDLMYGLFTNAEGETLALAARSKPREQAPKKDAWKGLGIAQSELTATQKPIQRTHRLGQEVVEVAVPLFGEEKEPLGTIRYALSTKRMHTAIAQAKAEARAQQLEFVKLIGATVTLATLMGILLSRLQAGRITLPVQDLTRAATDLAGGDRNVRVRIESGDELEMLGFSFNRMVWELSTSYEKLEDLNRSLEHKVEERTLALASRNQDMRAVLDNVDQGLITATPDGRMAPERSAAVDTWFGPPRGTPTLWQFLASHSAEFALNLEVGWEQITDALLPLDLAIDQLPKRLSCTGNTYQVRYLPLVRDEKLESVLVVMADITSQLLHEREEAEARELTQAFRRLMKDRAGFMAFLEEASGMLETIAARSTTESTVKTTLHTLKGNAGLLGLSVIAKLCHELEDSLTAHGVLSAPALAQLQERWKALVQHVAQLAPMNQGVLEIREEDLGALVALLRRSGHSEAIGQIEAWKLEPVRLSLTRLAEQAQGLAKRLGKGDIEVEVVPTSLRLDRERFGSVFSELSHVIRNAVDHGLESSEDRESAGKSRNGCIRLGASHSDGMVTIEISDDGRGIDWDSIRTRGKALQMPAETPADLLAILCGEGFSTRTEVTEISGRGVGLAAVKRRLEELGGHIEVQSTPGHGTRWSFVAPFLGG